MRLEFYSYNGKVEATVGHGQECVALSLREKGARYGLGGIVLTPEEAHALGTRLQQQARSARKATHDR